MANYKLHLDLKLIYVHRCYGAKCDYCLLVIKCRDITMMTTAT